MKAGLSDQIYPTGFLLREDPKLAKLIKQQIASKGVEAGPAGAQKAAQAGVKGTEKLDAKGVTFNNNWHSALVASYFIISEIIFPFRRFHNVLRLMPPYRHIQFPRICFVSVLQELFFFIAGSADWPTWDPIQKI